MSKRILGALALVLSLCFISSAILIDNNESGQEIVLSAPEPTMESNHYYSYIICIGDVEHRYADIHYVAYTNDTILDGVLSIDEYNSLVNQGYVFEYRIGSKTGSSIDFHTAENLGYYGYSEIYVIASLPPGTLSDDGTRLIQAPSNATEFTIPEGVNTVAGYAFFKCKDLKSITFPESVKTLEPHTFDGLGQDITVSIPYSATYMDSVPPFFNIVRTGTPPLTHTVTFNTNGGNDIASQTIEDGRTATKPAMPEKHGYYFSGWYGNEALTSSFSFSSKITADTTLYAKWVPAIYLHIKVLDDGGQDVRKGNLTSYGIVSENYDGTGPYENIELTDFMISDGFTFIGSGEIAIHAFQLFDNGYLNQAIVTSNDVRGLLGLNTTSTELDRKVLSEYHQDVYATYKNNHWYIRTNEYADNYTVSFNSNGGSAVASQTVAIDSTAAKPTDPTKSNYAFAGWYTDAELTMEYDFTAPVSANISLYAKWNSLYPAPTSDNYDANSDFAISNVDELVAFKELVNSGKTFESKTIHLVADIYLKGIKFSPIGIDYNICFKGTFDGHNFSIYNLSIQTNDSSKKYTGLFGYINGGSVKNVNLVNSSVSSSAGMPYVGGIVGYLNSGSIQNCHTNGYAGSSAPTAWVGGIAGYYYGSISDCSNTGTVTANTTYNAYVGGIVGYQSAGSDMAFTITNCYNLGTVSANCRNAESTNYKAYAGGICGQVSGITAIDCYNLGNVSANGTYSCAAGGIFSKQVDVLNGYMEFESTPSGIIRCYNTGNITISSGTNGSAYGLGPANTSYGYNTGDVTSNVRCFSYAAGIGIGTIENCYNTGDVNATADTMAYSSSVSAAGIATSGSVVNCYSTGTVTGSIERGTSISVMGICQGTSVNSYCITGAAEYAYGNDNTVGFKTSDEMKSADFASLLGSAYLQAPSGYLLNGNAYSYPVLAEQATYNVTFNTNGGNHIAPQKVDEGSKVVKPADPTKSGYTFAGWYSNSALTTAFDFNSAVNGDFVLYAKWNIITYTVKFESNGGSEVASKTVNHGSTLSKPSAPTKSGFVFGGWYSNSELTAEYSFSAFVTSNMTLYAKWLEECIVTFESNGGSEVASQIIGAGTIPAIPSEPTKSGFVFGGWYTDVALTSEYAFTTGITSNQTLYAKWYDELSFTTAPSIQNVKVTVDGRTITATATAENFEYLLWDMGDGSEPVKTYTNSIAYTYSSDGNYTVKVTAYNSKGQSETISQDISVSEGGSDKGSSNDGSNSIMTAGIVLLIIGAILLIITKIKFNYYTLGLGLFLFIVGVVCLIGGLL